LAEKKVISYPAETRKVLITGGDEAYSVRRQCELLGVNRSTLYYQPVGESELNLQLMRLLDEQYTRTPCYGVLRMEAYLRSLGYAVNAKRVRRLLRTPRGGVSEARHQHRQPRT
jgi:putative transposase